MERKRKEVQSRMAGGGAGGGRGGGHWGIGELILRLGRGFWPLSLPLHCHVTSQER